MGERMAFAALDVERRGDLLVADDSVGLAPMTQLEQAQALMLRSAAEEIEELRRRSAYWERKCREAREVASEATRCRREMADERDALRETVEQFIDLHSPRTPAIRRRYAEDERGWNMMLNGAVLAAVANWREESDPVHLCEVCEGQGAAHVGPDWADDMEECSACDGEGEVGR
jgi:hypothetical protein